MKEFKFTGVPVTNIGLPPYIAKVLIAHDIKLVSDLCCLSRQELIEKVKGVAAFTASIIQNVLRSNHLKLGMPPNELVGNDGKCEGCGMLIREGMRKLHEKNCKHYADYKLNEEGVSVPSDSENVNLQNRKEIQYILACERDTGDPFNNSGPIAMEQMLGKATLADIVERSNIYGSKYGKKAIFKLVYVGDPDKLPNLSPKR